MDCPLGSLDRARFRDPDFDITWCLDALNRGAGKQIYSFRTTESLDLDYISEADAERINSGKPLGRRPIVSDREIVARISGHE